MHWPHFWESFGFISYLGGGAITWAGYGAITFFGRTKMQLLEKPRKPQNPPPSVSLLIPAKDEGEGIRGCLQSALDQDWPNLQVIAIDDRSTDQTGAVMDAMAVEDPRLKVLHIQPATLGPGWTGKNNALFTGTKHATGDWLLFVDSDVLLQPDAVSKTVTVSAHKKYDLFSVLPKLEARTLWERALIPLCSAAAATMYMIALTNDDDNKRVYFANGQFLLTTRAAYDAIGGHETVKDRLCEDTEIGRLMKMRGFRTRVSWGSKYVSVRMYKDLGGIIKGWSRIYYAAKVGDPTHIILAMLFVIFNAFSAYFLLGYGIWRAVHPIGNFLDYAWLAAAIVHLALMMVFLSNMYRWSKNAGWYALLFPITGLILLRTLCKALVMCVTKKVEWRGTSYSHTMSDQLAVKP